MIRNQKILNSKEIKQILSVLKDQFGFDRKLDYVFFENTKERIYIANRDFESLPYEKLNVDSIGLYVFARMSDGIRLTIEGARIVGPHCTKNIIDLTKDQLHSWLKGEDFEVEPGKVPDGHYVVRYNNDFFGSTKVKSGHAFNYLSKSRRLKVIND